VYIFPEVVKKLWTILKNRRFSPASARVLSMYLFGSMRIQNTSHIPRFILLLSLHLYLDHSSGLLLQILQQKLFIYFSSLSFSCMLYVPVPFHPLRSVHHYTTSRFSSEGIAMRETTWKQKRRLLLSTWLPYLLSRFLVPFTL